MSLRIFYYPKLNRKMILICQSSIFHSTQLNYPLIRNSIVTTAQQNVDSHSLLFHNSFSIFQIQQEQFIWICILLYFYHLILCFPVKINAAIYNGLILIKESCLVNIENGYFFWVLPWDLTLNSSFDDQNIPIYSFSWSLLLICYLPLV